MNIVVYCGAGYGKSDDYTRAAFNLGKYIAKNGHTLVFGASSSGLMKEVCDGALSEGGHVIGVIPDIDFIVKLKHPGLSEEVYTPTLAERRTKMIELGDAFIALPGGLGTLDEITEVIELCKIGELSAPVVLYNVNNYYAQLEKMFDQMMGEGFLDNPGRLLVSDDLEEIGGFIWTRKH
ncbi:MAG: TIGR00730 family Rossman fold protein [Lachnospiraceae bacterium]|nr:TIGR00730 family Rossman fold protein [Lachnospiraceae bacterium]